MRFVVSGHSVVAINGADEAIFAIPRDYVGVITGKSRSAMNRHADAGREVRRPTEGHDDTYFVGQGRSLMAVSRL